MADSEKKRKEVGNTKIWISTERKELSGWNEKHFSLLFNGYYLVKIWKIEDTSFKLQVLM